MQVSNFVPTVNEAAATYKGKRKVNSVEKKRKRKQEDTYFHVSKTTEDTRA